MEYFVAFTDESETEISASFGCEQDPAVWRNQGIVSADDPRWKAYVASFAAEAFTASGQSDSLNPSRSAQ